jgi:phosphoadenosine phosphosulfate reductase
MSEAARLPDVIDTAPAFTAEQVAALNARFVGDSAADMLAELLSGELQGRVAVVSSFGAESAVLLDLVAAVDRSVPLIFINTQKMYGETLAYRDSLAEQLGFTDLRVYRPDPYEIARRDDKSLRWA